MNHILFQNADIEDLVRQLKNGATLVYPTETCYGLGCDAGNELAVSKIFSIKKRQAEKTVLVTVPEPAMIMRYIDWNQTLENLATRFWPGPLTAVVRVVRRMDLASGVIGKDETIAFRITSHVFAKELGRALKNPLVSTSANISSLKSPYDAGEVIKMFQDQVVKPDILIDAGILPYALPSTVVKVEDDGTLSVLRQGEIIIN